MLVRLLEAALSAVWTRTGLTLGEVTLTAIAERVLYNATEKFPLFSALTVDPNRGVQFGELYERISSDQGRQLVNGIRFLLVDLLTVIGNLTAEILTPELHLVLFKVALPKAVRVKKGTRSAPPRSKKDKAS